MDSRRGFLAVLGFSVLSGCSRLLGPAARGADRALNDGDGTETPDYETTANTRTENDGFENFTESNEQFVMTTEIVSTSNTEPRIVSKDQIQRQNKRDTFTLTIQNTGIQGDIGVTLYWQNEEVSSDIDELGVNSAEFVVAFTEHRSNDYFFNSGERRTVEVTGDPPEDAIGYYFRTVGMTRKVTLHNDGPDEYVQVVMKDKGGNVLDQKKIQIREGQEKEVTFSGEYDSLWSDSEFEFELEQTVG